MENAGGMTADSAGRGWNSGMSLIVLCSWMSSAAAILNEVDRWWRCFSTPESLSTEHSSYPHIPSHTQYRVLYVQPTEYMVQKCTRVLRSSASDRWASISAARRMLWIEESLSVHRYSLWGSAHLPFRVDEWRYPLYVFFLSALFAINNIHILLFKGATSTIEYRVLWSARCTYRRH